MSKFFSLLLMLFLSVCVSSCGTKYARPDRCVCKSCEPVVQEPVKQQEPVAEPEPVPEPEPVQTIKDVIKESIKEKKEIKIDFEKLVKESLFDFDSDEISQDSYAGLDLVAEFLKENPNVTVKVEGHTDNVGSEIYNQDLSERRAKSVANYIIDKGVDADRVSTEGFGFSKPIADNDSDEGRAQNRRTELVFTVNPVESESQN